MKDHNRFAIAVALSALALLLLGTLHSCKSPPPPEPPNPALVDAKADAYQAIADQIRQVLDFAENPAPFPQQFGKQPAAPPQPLPPLPPPPITPPPPVP